MKGIATRLKDIYMGKLPAGGARARERPALPISRIREAFTGNESFVPPPVKDLGITQLISHRGGGCGWVPCSRWRERAPLEGRSTHPAHWRESPLPLCSCFLLAFLPIFWYFPSHRPTRAN